MLNTLVFYNHCNKGDIHVSRELVRFLIKAVPAKAYVYAHRWSPRLTLDLPVSCGGYISESNRMPVFPQNSPFFHDPGANLLALNTWYAMSPRFQNTWCSLNTLVDLFQFHIDRHDIKAKLPPIEKLIPKIDYSRYFIEKASAFLSSGSWRKRVMVCDGPVLSGQSGGSLDDFRAAVAGAVIAHPDVQFFMTERSGLRAPNVAYTADVIGFPDGETDLCECSYVSTRCDVVIGRGSGPYTFAYVAENFLDPKKVMVCFTDGESTAKWVYPESIVKAKILWSNDYSVASMRAKIEEALR